MLTYILYIVMKEITFTERLKMKVLNEVLAFMANFPNHIFILTVKTGLKSECFFCFFLSLDVDASTPTCLSLSLLRWFNRPGNACISC